jgi:N-acetylglucosamine transport system permease protein
MADMAVNDRRTAPAGGGGPGHAVPKKTSTEPSKLSDRVFGGFSHLFLIVWALMVAYPILWVVVSSF